MAWRVFVTLVAAVVVMSANTAPRYAQSLGKIVFHSIRDARNRDIYVMNPDGTMQTRLTNNPDEEEHPTLSPDRQKIAFEAWRVASGGIQYEIFVMSGDGSDRTLLRPGRDPMFGPDGKTIVFVHQRGPDTEFNIHVMDADGLNVKRLTDGPANDRNPSFSPDGKMIVFESNRDYRYPASLVKSDIYTMNADGSNIVRLTRTGEGSNPRFSPDGRRVIFASGCQIHIMDASGGNARSITRGCLRPGPPHSLAVSPDGRKIVFESLFLIPEQASFGSDLFVMDADGANITRLTNTPGLDGDPDWK